MGKTSAELDDDLVQFISDQPMFFVSTAPSVGGHVNVSPKGLDTFAVVGPTEVAYLDLTGSGVETIAHLRENGRITLMFCAFTGSPNIVRIYGSGHVIRPDDERFAVLRARFGEFDAVRSIIHVAVERVSDSCGYGVPLMEYKGERRALFAWAAKKSPEEILEYQQTRNAASIDDLPAL